MSSGVGAFFVFQLTRPYSLEESHACTRIFQTAWTKGAPLNEQNSCEAAISTERAVLRIESGASELEKNEPLNEHGTCGFTAEPEGEWISRDGQLKQVFQSNV